MEKTRIKINDDPELPIVGKRKLEALINNSGIDEAYNYIEFLYQHIEDLPIFEDEAPSKKRVANYLNCLINIIEQGISAQNFSYIQIAHIIYEANHMKAESTEQKLHIEFLKYILSSMEKEQIIPEIKTEVLKASVSSGILDLLGYDSIPDIVHDIGSNPDFFKYLQSSPINKISRAQTKKDDDTIKVDLLGNAQIQVDENFILKIDEFSNFKDGIPVTALMLLDCFIIHFTNSGRKDVRIRLPLREFMEMRGLSHERKARQKILSDIEILKRVGYQAREKIKGKWVDSGSISIYGGTGFIKNSIIHFNFNVDFFAALCNAKVMEYSRETLKANPHKNPHAYYISRFIDENYRLNEGKIRVSTIGVKTLLERLPLLPTFEDVSLSKKQQVFQLIIYPVIRDLDSIDRLLYDFVDDKGNKIETPEIHFKGVKGYDAFISSKIRIDYSDYEKHPERIEKLKKHQKKALSSSKKTSN